MRYELVLKVFAESEATGETVELCPGGLVESHASIDTLLCSVQVACEQGWGAVSTEELSDFYTLLKHEAGAIARMLDIRERAATTAPPGKVKSSQGEANTR